MCQEKIENWCSVFELSAKDDLKNKKAKLKQYSETA